MPLNSYRNNIHLNLRKVALKKLFFLGFLLFLNINDLVAQEKELSLAQLAEQYECPEWFRDVKFEIWFHREPQSVRGEDIEIMEGELRNTTDSQKHGEHFNQRAMATPAFSLDEVRYTTKGDDFYITVMNPVEGEFTIPSLGKSSDVNPGKSKILTQVYNHKKLSFKESKDKLTIAIPAVNGEIHPVVLKEKFKNTQF